MEMFIWKYQADRDPGDSRSLRNSKWIKMDVADIPKWSPSGIYYLSRGYGWSKPKSEDPLKYESYWLRDANREWPGGGPYAVPGQEDFTVNESPDLTVERVLLENGKVDDHVKWTAARTAGVVGYDTRRTTDGGRYWWTHKGRVDDPAKREWSTVDDAGEEWDNKRRGFQVRYDFGDKGMGPWSEIEYVE